jgi:Enolase C-terminal domain-like
LQRQSGTQVRGRDAQLHLGRRALRWEAEGEIARNLVGRVSPVLLRRPICSVLDACDQRAHALDRIRPNGNGLALPAGEKSEFGRVLEECGFYWYEEPMREFDLTSYRKLADSLDMPVLAAETSDGVHWNAATWIDMAALDMVRTSSFYKGGLTGALKIAHLAEAHGMKAEVHGMGVANAHLGAAIATTTFANSWCFRPSTSRGSENRTSCPSLTALSRRRRRLGWAPMSIGPRSKRPRLP